MEIEASELPGGVTDIHLRGRLDAPGADRIGIKFTAHAVAQGRPAIVDLSGVDFVASMGLRLIIATAKAMRSKGLGFALYGAQPMVQEVLDQSAIDQIVAVAADRDAALALLDT
jgi:anti-anti-sigma factor